MILELRDLDLELWREIVELYTRDPVAHAYLMYDLIYELKNTELLVDYERGIRGYALVWKRYSPWGIQLYGSVERLLERIPRGRARFHVPISIAGAVLELLENSRNVELEGYYLDMVVDYERFRPVSPERAVRLSAEHLDQFLRLKGIQGRPLEPEVAAERLRKWRYYGVFEEGELVSVACAYLRLPEVWAVGDVYTRPDFRGRGYAKISTSAVTRDAVNSGAMAFLHVKEDNEPAIKVYKSLGYEIVGKKLWILST